MKAEFLFILWNVIMSSINVINKRKRKVYRKFSKSCFQYVKEEKTEVIGFAVWDIDLSFLYVRVFDSSLWISRCLNTRIHTCGIRGLTNRTVTKITIEIHPFFLSQHVLYAFLSYAKIPFYTHKHYFAVHILIWMSFKALFC